MSSMNPDNKLRLNEKGKKKGGRMQGRARGPWGIPVRNDESM